MNEIDTKLPGFTMKQVAEMFGVTLATIRRWKKIGTLEPDMMTPGGKPLYSRKAIDASCMCRS